MIENHICKNCKHNSVCKNNSVLVNFDSDSKKYIGVDISIKNCDFYSPADENEE